VKNEVMIYFRGIVRLWFCLEFSLIWGNLWTSPRFIYLIYCPISNQILITFTVEICLRNYVMIYGVLYGSIFNGRSWFETHKIYAL
jgi:hypothetical protein